MSEYNQIIQSDDVSIFVVDDKQEIKTNNEIDKDDDIRFIMMTNDILNSDYHDDNTIFISTDWTRHVGRLNVSDSVMNLVYKDYLINRLHTGYNNIEYAELVWQVDRCISFETEYIEEGKENEDFDGYRHTMDVVTQSRKIVNDYNNKIGLIFKYIKPDKYQLTNDLFFPAIFAAYNATEEINGNVAYGYLPSIGQMCLISKHVMILNQIMRLIGESTFMVRDVYNYNNGIGIFKSPDYVMEHDWLTSSLYSEDKVWYMYYKTGYCPKMEYRKYVFPIFHNVV